ncbi:MAG TPA: hypothetical protein VE866_01735, partial [Candidatus Binatia bacterium]|nr:hypothetical protein [Candidatus Binatia bacterium]
MKTQQLIPPLRDLPAGRMAVRKQHLLAETIPQPDTSWLRSPKRILSLKIGVHGTVLSRRRRIIVAVVLAAGGSALAATSTLGGAAQQKYDAVPAANVAAVIAQVQQTFGDGLIQSASVDGSTLAVNVATSKSDSVTVAGFEAGVLAHAVADWQGAHGKASVTQVSLVEMSQSGTQAQPQVESINSASTATPLARGACEAVAQNARASLTIVSARTLPFAGGTCLIKVQTSGDPNAVAGAIADAKSNAIQNPNDYASLIEV